MGNDLYFYITIQQPEARLRDLMTTDVVARLIEEGYDPQVCDLEVEDCPHARETSIRYMEAHAVPPSFNESLVDLCRDIVEDYGGAIHVTFGQKIFCESTHIVSPYGCYNTGWEVPD